MKPSTRSERPQSLSVRSGSIGDISSERALGRHELLRVGEVDEWAAAAGHAQPVIAPTEALETVAAYFAMTPDVNSGSGGS